MSTIILFIITIILLIISANVYIKLARKFGIIDTPNHRSSHTLTTIRGGGILFVISIFTYFFTNNLPLPYLFTAIFIVATVSFIDDIKTLGTISRLLAQIIAVILVFFEVDLFSYPIYLIIPILIFCLGFINIYNFMDGINGITGFYSISVIFAILALNYTTEIIDYKILIFALLGLLVFGYYNFRKKALFFAGDIGSISIGVFIVYLLLLFSLQLKSPLPFMFVSVYLVDGGVTILRRLLKKENIFKPHKSHLYQQLVHTKSISHLNVAGLFAFTQLIIDILIITILLNVSEGLQIILATLIILLLIISHITINRRLILSAS